MKPLTRTDLDRMGCDAPGCDHTSHQGPMVPRGRCHPSAGTWCYYQDGVLTVRCRICELMILEIAVAEGPEPPADRDETIVRAGRALGEALAFVALLDPTFSRNEGMVFVRMASERLREHVPPGKSALADGAVAQFATMLRQAWGAAPGISADALDPATATVDPPDVTAERVSLANDFLRRMPLPQRQRFLAEIHFCQRCGADRSNAPCPCGPPA